MTPKHYFMPTPFVDLNTVLQELVNGIESILNNHFTGAYLQGSFAVGDFDQHSDVDFIVVISEELPAEKVQPLQDLHACLYQLDSPWAQHLEGSYFPQEMLRQHDDVKGLIWYLDHGSNTLVRSDHCNSVLVRWVLRECGVILVGPPPATLIDSIPITRLQEEILTTMRNWGREIVTQPDRYNNRFYQGYIVLNYCRMLHDLRRGSPGSKRTGAEWAQQNLDPRWHGLIDRAWDCRPDPALAVRQRADPADFASTLQFIQYVIALGEQFMC